MMKSPGTKTKTAELGDISLVEVEQGEMSALETGMEENRCADKMRIGVISNVVLIPSITMVKNTLRRRSQESVRPLLWWREDLGMVNLPLCIIFLASTW